MSNPRLYIVDGQRTFDFRYGSLGVPGTDKTAEATAKFIAREGHKFGQINLQFDTHGWTHWSFAVNWVNDKGENPKLVGNYAMLTEDDIVSGKWRYRHGAPDSKPKVLGGKTIYEHSVEYVRKVGRIDMWPVHAVPDTDEWALQPEIARSIGDWSVKTGVDPVRLMKGKCKYVDQYSGLEAAFFLAGDHSTGPNNEYFKSAEKSAPIIVVGIEGAHCVKDTFLSKVKYMGAKTRDMVILTDCVGVLPNFGSPEVNFADQWEAFLHDMQTNHGVTVTNSVDFRL